MKQSKTIFVIVRTYSAGVHAGIVESREGKEITLLNSIRIWYWSGAASLSELAAKGPKNPKQCKFGVPVPRITLTEAIEIIECTPEGVKAINDTPSWES